MKELLNLNPGDAVVAQPLLSIGQDTYLDILERTEDDRVHGFGLQLLAFGIPVAKFVATFDEETEEFHVNPHSKV